MTRVAILTMLLWATIVEVNGQTGRMNVNFTVVENGKPTPCNVRIQDASGNFHVADSTYMWKTFFGKTFPDYPSSGVFTVKLLPGKYRYEIDRGPEYLLTVDSFELGSQDIYLRPELKRIIDMKSRNWWSGELHIHRKLPHIERLMQASDLHIAPVITSWNEHYYVKADSMYDNTPKKFDTDRYFTTAGSEDERSGGAILVLNTASPVDFSKDHKPEYPPLAASVKRVENNYVEKSWIDIDKPFWWDLPILLATGHINSVGIAHNHMNRDGVFDNEAWGKARDTLQYPAPMGNGYWTQDLFYRILNAGVKVTPSAGSASGVLMNPVGYNRMYVYVDNNFNYYNWFRKLKEGRLFVTNGPMLLTKVNGRYPGEIFQGDGPVTLAVENEIYSRDSIDVVEIIKNGRIYATVLPAAKGGNRFSAKVSFDSSGWFLVRAITKTAGNFRFASTAPYYVEIGKDKQHISAAAVRFFLQWTNDRAKSIKVETEQERSAIFQFVDSAKAFWENKLSLANAE